jgi:hypothetical protein
MGQIIRSDGSRLVEGGEGHRGIVEFAVSPDYTFDPSSQRFRYRDTKKFAPRAATLALTERYISGQKQSLIGLSKQYHSGAIGVGDFQRQAAEHVKNLHLSQMVLGRGGLDNVTPQDFLKVARELKRQYKDGKGADGEKFGLKHLVADLGNMSELQLANRLRMYGDASVVSYWAGAIGDAEYGIRRLGVAEHCPDCVAYAAEPPKPIADVPLPTQNCQCRSQCKCSILGLSLAEAIKLGLKV